MFQFRTCVAFLLAFLFTQDVSSLASTDTITWGGDNSRTGYQTNHNMDPSVVGSSSFGQLYRVNLPGNFQNIGPEQVYSQPLVYTGSDGVQYVYVATTQNNVYKINAKTGVIVASRNLHVPFLTADLDGCVDINPTVGVTATGVIDPDTGIWYLTAKTYSDAYQSGMFSKASPPGRLQGRYYFHAIQLSDLSEVSGFPKMIDGLIFRNSNGNRMFIGGNQHARPGMLLAKDFVYTGWASHCVQYNFTGAVIGFHKKTGEIVESFTMEGGPEPNTVKGAGVWMSGGGIAYDGKGSMFLASGNGYASQLAATGNSLSGRQPPTSLEEAAVRFSVADDGKITPVDFFMPWEKTQLDGADKDLGTSPLQLLPSDTFTCANVARMGVVTGKSGKTYLLNLDNLGGYQNGANKLDAVLQVIQNENSVYAGAGVMPLGGGYIYINVIQYQTHVYKFSCSSSGDPQLTLVANTPEKNAYILGVGHGTTTSLNGQEGTGMLWTSDVEGQNLRIYNAIPDNGNLTLIKSFNVPGVTKFSRPVFGDGIAYLGTTLGYLYAFGSPVNLPLNCSSPYTFPNTAIGSTSTPVTITCQANIGVTVTGLALGGNTNFKFTPVTTPLTLAAGQTFSINATFAPATVGLLSSDILVNTTNNVAQYSTSTPITLKGTANSAKPLLAIAPNTVSFNVVAGQQAGGVTQSSLFSNRGDSLLTIQSILYSTTSETGPWVTPNVTADGSVQVGYFTFSSVPQTINANSVATVSINYNPSVAGNHAVYLKVASDGGSSLLDVLGVAGTNPVTLIEFQTPDGSGWVTYQPGVPFSFGNVLENQIKNLKMRITNNGSSSAVPLSLTVSKPPYGVNGIIAAVNNVDLAEGTLLQAGQNQTATLYCSVPRSQINVPSYNGSATWTLNTGDPNLGKQIIQFSCNAVSEQVGPLLSNGTAQYGYVGCFQENTPGRQLATNPFSGSTTTNDLCIAKCYSLGYKFAGTQYQTECWCGNAIPLLMDSSADCNYNCAGNVNQTCGGNGYFHTQAHISLFADSTKFNGTVVANQTLSIVQSYQGYNYMGCYAESGGKTISAATSNTNSMTIEACGDFCIAKGYKLFGVEYASECYCGSTIASTSKLTDDSKCSMSCKGSNAEYCGAGSFMSLYGYNMTKGGTTSSSSSAASISSSTTGGSSSTSATVTTSSITSSSSSAVPSVNLSGYIYQGCYNETHDRRALADLGRGGVTTNTLESCAAYCAGYTYFGVEYGSECYCGKTLYANSIKQSTEAGCSMACAGNSAETCGGPDFLNVYMLNSTASSSSSSSVSSTTTSASSSTTASITSSASSSPSTVSSSSSSATSATPTGPVAKPTVGSYVYQGCYTEVGGRALTAKSYSNSSNSLEFCASFCTGYTYWATEYASECYCGNTLNSASVPATDGRCNALCSADKFEYCGGGNGLSLYKFSSSVSSSSSSTSSSSSSSSSSVSSTSSSTISSASSSSSSTSSSLSSTVSSTSSTSSILSSSSSSSASSSTDSSSSSSATSSSSSFSTTPSSSASSSVTSSSSTVSSSVSSSTASSSTDSSSSSTASSTTTSTSSSSSSSSVSSSSTASSTSSDSSSSVSSSPSSSISSTSTSSSVTSSGSSTSTTSYANGATPAVGGVTYLVETDTSYSGTLINLSRRKRATASSLNSCLNICASSTSCVGTSYNSNTSSCSFYSGVDSASKVSTPGTDFATVQSRSTSSTSSTVSSSSSSISSSSSSISSSSSSASSSVSSSSSSSSSSSTASSSSTSSSATSSSSSVSSSSSTSSTSSSVSSTSSTVSSSSSSTTSSISSSSSSSSSTSTSATPTGPTVIPTVSSYVAQGCFSEATSGRALAAITYANNSMTPAICAAKCVQYAWFGVEYANECYCGPYLRSGSVQVSDSDCNMQCAGNKTALCGAGNRLNVYKSNDTNKASTDPMNLDTVGNYAFYSCYKDNTRALSVTQANDNMTVGNCQALAVAGNYAWFGVEYGRECWMGNSLASGTSNATASDCNMACKGNPGQLCGGGSRLSLYKRSS